MSITELLGMAMVMTPVLVAVLGAILLALRRQSLAQRGVSPQDQELMACARRMEQRMSYLETVLDTEAPGWRSRSEAR